MHNHRVSLLLVSAAVLWPASSRFAWADSAPRPACAREAAAVPAAPGSTLPANVPAFLFVPPLYASGMSYTVERFGIELRDGAGGLVPTSIEAVGPNDHGYSGYFVRPRRALTVGEVVLSFLEDCPPYGGPALRDSPVRNERYSYHVVPAVPVPTALGTATLRSINYFVSPSACHRPEGAQVIVEVRPTPEALAFRELLTLEPSFVGDPYRWSNVLYDTARKTFVTVLWKGSLDEHDRLKSPGQSLTVEMRTAIPGLATSIMPARVPVTLDWSDRPADAGPPFCYYGGGGLAEPPGNGGRAEGGVPDSRGGMAEGGVPDSRGGTAEGSAPSAGISDGGSLPDASTSATAEPARDGSAVVAGPAPSHAQGYSCSVGATGHGAGAPGLFALGAFLLVRMARKRRRHGTTSTPGQLQTRPQTDPSGTMAVPRSRRGRAGQGG